MKRIISFVVALVVSALALGAPRLLSAQSGDVSSPGADQRFRFERLTTDDGLSSSHTEDILQDHRGFIWIATRNGLNRYDGHDLKVYKHDGDNPHSLGLNSTFKIIEDRSGMIWVGLFGRGVERFDPVTEQFTHYRHDPADPNSLSNDGTNYIYSDKAGNIWVATLLGLNKFNPEHETFTRYQRDSNNPQSLRDNVATRVLEDHTGQFWVGGLNGLQQFDATTGVFSKPYLYDPQSVNNEVGAIYEDRTNVLWIGAPAGLYRFDREMMQFIGYRHDPDDPTSLPNEMFTSIHEDREGNFWLGAISGRLYLFDRETAKARRYIFRPKDRIASSSNGVTKIYEDNTGTIWVVGDNVTKFDPSGRRFETFQHNPRDPNSLAGNQVFGIHETQDGLLWIADAKNGVTRFDRANQQFTRIADDPNGPGSRPNQQRLRHLAGNDETLWLATWGGGLRQLNLKTKEFITYRSAANNSNALSYDWLTSVHLDKAGQVWIGTQIDGLNKYDPVQDLFTHYSHDPDNPNSISGDDVVNVHEDTQGNIWVATTSGGLNKLDPRTNGIVRYQHDPDDTNSVSHDNLWMVHEDHKGQLWIATVHGLNRFEPETETFTRYFDIEGLADPEIQSIVGDDRGYLWLGTSGGLSRFDPETGAFRTYDVHDGLPSNQFNPQAAYKSQTGELLFGTSAGLLLFNPEAITANRDLPPVVLTDFQLFNQSVPIRGANASLQDDTPGLTQVIDTLEGIALEHNQSVFSFRFAALNFRASAKNRYAYKMEGFDTHWNYVDSANRLATYTNLDPGDYTFRVKAANNDGIWNEEGKAIKVTIIPPWWLTNWFRGLAALFILGLVSGGYRWRVQAVETRNLQLEVQVDERTQALKAATQEAQSANQAKSEFLANMSHELRTPLNAIIGFTQMMEHSPDMTKEHLAYNSIINQSGDHLLGLINDILDLAKIEAGKTDVEEGDVGLKIFLDGVIAMLSVKAQSKDLPLVLACDDDLPDYIRTDELKLRQIIINLLGNAIKFTERGQITVTADYKKAGEAAPFEVPSAGQTVAPSDQLWISIEDTGQGIAEAELDKLFKPFEQTKSGRSQTEGTGLGLSLCKHFVELLGGEISVSSVLGEGATFQFYIPVQTISDAETTAIVREVMGLAPNQPHYKILVVEDIQFSRLLLITLMQSLGLEVKAVTNGREAVDCFLGYRPDLIWMDIGMPVMDGKEATAAIRQLDGGGTVKIIALTASTLQGETASIMAYGCDDVMLKPFREAELFAAMHDHLGIEFTYGGNITATQHPDDSKKLNAEALGALSDTIINTIHLAAVEGDIDKLQKTLDELPQTHKELTESLRQLVSDFDFAILIELAGQAIEARQSAKLS